MASDPYLRYPTIRGDRVVFVTDDDLWAASVDGGAAWRLGAERATIRTPKLSPDGRRVAWSSDAGGHAEGGGGSPARGGSAGGGGARARRGGAATAHLVG